MPPTKVMGLSTILLFVLHSPFLLLLCWNPKDLALVDMGTLVTILTQLKT